MIRMTGPHIENGLISFRMVKEVYGSITIVQKDFPLDSKMNKQDLAITIIKEMRDAIEELNGEVNVKSVRA